VHFGRPSIEGIVSDLKAVPWIVSTHVNVTPTDPYDQNPYSAGTGELRCAVDLDKLLEYVPNPGPVAEPGSPIFDYEDKEELSQWCNGQSTTTVYITVDQFRDDPEYCGYAETIWLKVVKKYVAKYDAFISHASEDNVPFARPIADRPVAAGFRIWYDEFELKVGDSLIESVDRGLLTSRYAIVVPSEQFFKKEWPRRELAGLTTLELQCKKARFVLPVWYRISKEEVAAVSPPLADKLAIVSGGST
jgi:hypothetical protein